jgi:hypothetical protein
MRLPLAAGIVAALALALLPAAAPAASGAAPLRACGNTQAGGVLIGDIITRRVTCANARRVARAVPSDCGNQGTCTVRGFSCITARALEELRFARCSKPGNGNELFKLIRFDFGS